MKASVCIEMVYLEYPFLDRIKIAAEQGFDAVEFWNWDNKDTDAIRQVIEQTGIKIAIMQGNMGGTLINPLDRPGFIEGYTQSLKKAKELGVERLFLLTDELGEDRGVKHRFPHLSESEKRASVLEGMKALAPLAASHEVTLMMEPLNNLVDHPGYWLKHSDEGFNLVQTVNCPNIKLLFDIYHQQITEGNIISRLINNLDVIGYIHVADVPGRHQPGTGELNYAVIFDRLRQAGYEGYVGLEFSPTVPSKTAAAQALALIRG
jgi:hydroxypyruvate isomerase